MRLTVVLALVSYLEVGPDCGGGAPPVRDEPGSMLSAGADHTCAVDEGTVWCWGRNDRGQLGLGHTDSPVLQPAQVTLEELAAQIESGASSTCVRSITGRVWCWGSNDTGVLLGSGSSSATPVEITLPVPASSVSMRFGTALVVGSDGRLFGWGDNAEGQLGRGDDKPMAYPSPEPVSRAAFALRPAMVSAGQGHACAGGDALWCWGRNVRNELGVSSSEPQLRAPAQAFAAGSGVQGLAVGAFGSCAHDGARAWCWGLLPLDDQGAAIASATPQLVSLSAPVRTIDERWFHRCAVTADDTLWCWGRGVEGQLAGATTLSTEPRRVTDDVMQVSVGFFHTCYRRRSSGQWFCMGANDDGQLGTGDQRRRSEPTPVLR